MSFAPRARLIFLRMLSAWPALGLALGAAAILYLVRSRRQKFDPAAELAAARKQLAPVDQIESSPRNASVASEALQFAAVPFAPLLMAPLLDVAVGSGEPGLGRNYARETVLRDAAVRLEILKVLLPDSEVADSAYVAELHRIVDFMEHGTGLNLNVYRSASPARSILRVHILALQAVCDYRSREFQCGTCTTLPPPTSPAQIN